MAEKYPRDREFVRAFGERAERAGRETATVAEMLAAEAERKSGLTSTDPVLNERVRREIPRRLADAIDGGGKNGVEFHARWQAVEDKPTGLAGANLGIVFEARLPNYQIATGALVRATPVGSFPGGYATDLPAAAASMLERTPAAFAFAFPVEGSLKVVPANAIVAVENDGKPLPADFPERLYARSLGRFFEELVECFVGDQSLVASIVDSRGRAPHRLVTFGEEYGLEHVLYVGVRKDQPEQNLITDFE